MKLECSVSAPNSVILLGDSESADVPKMLDKSIVSATDTCVAIGTLMELDGETRILLTDEHKVIQHSGFHCAFRGKMTASSQCLSLKTVDG